MIHIEHLKVAIGGKTILNDINAELPDRGSVIIRGASGCGKTTLLRVLSGTISAESGAISGLSSRKIGIAYQDNRLLPWLDTLENVALISNRKTAEDVCKQFGLSDALQKRPGELSGGMQKRAALARAVAFTDDVLLLDEPFNGLDEELKHSIANMLRSHAELLITVSHDENDEMLLKADKVLKLDSAGLFEIPAMQI